MRRWNEEELRGDAVYVSRGSDAEAFGELLALKIAPVGRSRRTKHASQTRCSFVASKCRLRFEEKKDVFLTVFQRKKEKRGE